MKEVNVKALPSNNEQIVLRGWIRSCQRGVIDVDAARKELELCGVQVGAWDMFSCEFQECAVSMVALEKLDPLWGKYIWGLS